MPSDFGWFPVAHDDWWRSWGIIDQQRRHPQRGTAMPMTGQRRNYGKDIRSLQQPAVLPRSHRLTGLLQFLGISGHGHQTMPLIRRQQHCRSQWC